MLIMKAIIIIKIHQELKKTIKNLRLELAESRLVDIEYENDDSINDHDAFNSYCISIKDKVELEKNYKKKLQNQSEKLEKNYKKILQDEDEKYEKIILQREEEYRELYSKYRQLSEKYEDMMNENVCSLIHLYL